MAESVGERLVEFAPSEEWAKALRVAPRHVFVPDQVWDGVAFAWRDRGQDARAWWASVHSDHALITQVDDGEVALGPASAARVVNWTSSCSAPGVVFRFLELLEPYPGDRVVEVGTGTGWTAGLLSARLGADRVSSVEVDERVAAQAARNLARAGLGPRLVVDDGAKGDPAGAPFDRVHVTCGVADFPYAWVEQTRPGGIIVAPWMPNPKEFGYKVRLTVTQDAAVGRFYGGAGYTMLRSQRTGYPPITGEERHRRAHVDPRRISRAGAGLWVALAGLMPGVSAGGSDLDDGTHRYAVQHVSSGSHAIAVRPSDGGSAEVRQRGPRDLWHELEAAYLTWVGWSEPPIECFGLTVDAAGQHVWLYSPNNPISKVVR